MTKIEWLTLAKECAHQRPESAIKYINEAIELIEREEEYERK